MFEQLDDSDDVDWRFFDLETPASNSPLISSFSEEQSLPSKAPEQKLGTSQSSPKKATTGKHAGTKWENTFASSIILQHKGSPISRKQGPRKSGRRRGHLDPEQKRRASAVRKKGACWDCWLLKVPVSSKRQSIG
jgi:hypothetical protein